MLIISVVFNEAVGNDDIENVVGSLIEEDITAAIQEEEKLIKIMKDERVVALFHLFDLDMKFTRKFQRWSSEGT
jgi:hypothetical protein